MKTVFRTLALATVAVGLAFGAGSCKKLKSKLFQAFSANGASVDFTVPVIAVTGTKTDAGSVTHKLNIDSIIKAETGGTFGLKDIDKVTVEECRVKINNPDADNNFQNFEEAWVNLTTDANPTPLTLATGTIPDTYAEEFTIPAVSGADLKPYLTGNTLNYSYQARMRKATTQALNCTLYVKLRIQ